MFDRHRSTEDREFEQRIRSRRRELAELRAASTELMEHHPEEFSRMILEAPDVPGPEPQEVLGPPGVVGVYDDGDLEATDDVPSSRAVRQREPRPEVGLHDDFDNDVVDDIRQFEADIGLDY